MGEEEKELEITSLPCTELGGEGMRSCGVPWADQVPSAAAMALPYFGSAVVSSWTRRRGHSAL